MSRLSLVLNNESVWLQTRRVALAGTTVSAKTGVIVFEQREPLSEKVTAMGLLKTPSQSTTRGILRGGACACYKRKTKVVCGGVGTELPPRGPTS